jgi:hypothetical protein
LFIQATDQTFSVEDLYNPLPYTLRKAVNVGARMFVARGHTILQTHARPIRSPMFAAAVQTKLKPNVEPVGEKKLRAVMLYWSTVFKDWDKSIHPELIKGGEDRLISLYENVIRGGYPIHAGIRQELENISASAQSRIFIGGHCGMLPSDWSIKSTKLYNDTFRIGLQKRGLLFSSVDDRWGFTSTHDQISIGKDLLSKEFAQYLGYATDDPSEIVSFETCPQSIVAKRMLGIWTVGVEDVSPMEKGVVFNSRPDLLIPKVADYADLACEIINQLIQSGDKPGDDSTWPLK